MFAAPVLAAPVGIFDYNADVGHDHDPLDPLAIGITSYIYEDTYLITAGGWDIWADHDHFHYAYNEVSGSVRVEAKLRWQDAGWNDWAKMGVMLREDLAHDSIHYSTDHRKGGGDPWSKLNTTGDNAVFAQWRGATGAGSGGHDWWGAFPDVHSDVTLGIQRVNFGPWQVVQHMLKKDGTWHAFKQHVGVGFMAEDILAGVCVTAHDNAWAVQAKASEVAYTQDPDLLNHYVVPADTEQCSCDGMPPGFYIRSAKPGADPPYPSEWSYVGMNELLDGLTSTSEEGARVEQFVNLHDSDGRGVFANDQSFPGIDDFEQETSNPADGDNDDYFATEVIGCIELTAGPHVFAINSDDGAQMWIGGVFVGQTTEWKGASTEYILFTVEQGGLYSLRIRNLEGGGGASLEVMEMLADGSLVLANDTANGASPVCVPEPATIALLGFGGLAMLRIRKRR
jgi:hypothetical protein